MSQLLRLRRFLDSPPKSIPRPAQRCELCNADTGSQHSHVVDREQRRLLCVCRPCYLLFTHQGAGAGRYRSVGERFLRLSDSAVQWEMFEVPAGIAFFLNSSDSQRVIAFYPSPGGATESSVAVQVWEQLVRENPLIAGIEPDVEALLLCRRHGRSESWIVPVDSCYELVGRIRKRWRGFDGGEDAKREIDAFFGELERREQGSTICSI